MQIEVTQAQISTGVHCSVSNCPVAQALASLITPDCIIRVSPNAAFLQGGMERFDVTVPLPEPARNFVFAFDAGHEVKPFVFDMDIPAEFLAELKGAASYVD